MPFQVWGGGGGGGVGGGGLQLHNIKRFTMSLKTTWVRKLVLTDSSWTCFPLYYKIGECIICGLNYLEQIQPGIKRYILDRSVWHHHSVQIPLINRLKNKNKIMVAEFLDEKYH